MKIGKKEMDRKEKLEKLETLLKNVSDTYSDFVSCSMRSAEESDKYLDMLTTYIESHPTANTSEIILYEVEEILDDENG